MPPVCTRSVLCQGDPGLLFGVRRGWLGSGCEHAPCHASPPVLCRTPGCVVRHPSCSRSPGSSKQTTCSRALIYCAASAFRVGRRGTQSSPARPWCTPLQGTHPCRVDCGLCVPPPVPCSGPVFTAGTGPPRPAAECCSKSCCVCRVGQAPSNVAWRGRVGMQFGSVLQGPLLRHQSPPAFCPGGRLAGCVQSCFVSRQ
jgi:hypothetical protein